MKIREKIEQTFEKGDVIHMDNMQTFSSPAMLIPTENYITCDENGICDDNSGQGDYFKIIKRCRIKYTIYE